MTLSNRSNLVRRFLEGTVANSVDHLGAVVTADFVLISPEGASSLDHIGASRG